MPKFDPQLSQMSSNPYISQGVRDNAMAGLLENAASIGIDAYTGYQEAGLQKQIQGLGDEFFDRERAANSGEAQQYLEQFGALKMGEEELLLGKDVPSPDTQMQFIRGMEQKLGKFSAAAKQGRMSIDELQTRILSTTREAINRNPMIQRELLQTADKYMELSGLGSFIKQEQKQQQDMAKEYADYVKELRSEANKRNIPNSFQMDVPELEQSLTVARKRDYAINELEAQSKVSQYITKEQAQKWISEKGNDALNGHLDRVNAVVQSIFKNNNTNSWAPVKYQIGELIAGAKREFDSMIPQHLLNDPDVKEYRTRYTQNLEDMMTRMNTLGSGEDAAKAWQNEVTRLQSIQDGNLRRRLDVESANMGIKLMQAYPTGLLDGDNLEKAKAFLATTMGNMWNAPDAIAGLPKAGEVKPSASTGVMQSAVSIGEKEKDWTPLKQVLNSYNQGYSQIQDPKQRALFLEKNLDVLAKSDLTGLDTEGIQNVNKMIKSYFDDPNFGYKSLEKNLIKYPGVQMDVLDDGRLYFVGNEAEAFNKAFGNKINTALEAYAKANGQSVKEAAPRFYQEHMSQLVSTGEVKTQEEAWYARTPEDVISLLGKGKITEAEATHMLNGLFEATKLLPGEAAIPERLPQAEPTIAPPTGSSDFVKALKAGPKQQKDVKQESFDLLYKQLKDSLKGRQSIEFQKSPLWEKDPRTDAISSSDLTEAVIDTLTKGVNPAVGTAAAIAMVVFGPSAITSLAKNAPKMLSKAGKVAETNSNVVFAGGNVGANRAIVNSMIATANKTKKEKVEKLYKEFWTKEWMKNKVEMPKTDLEWSQAIAQANSWVAERLSPSMLKSMEK